jgi:hypothetical protein
MRPESVGHFVLFFLGKRLEISSILVKVWTPSGVEHPTMARVIFCDRAKRIRSSGFTSRSGKT